MGHFLVRIKSEIPFAFLIPYHVFPSLNGPGPRIPETSFIPKWPIPKAKKSIGHFLGPILLEVPLAFLLPIHSVLGLAGPGPGVPGNSVIFSWNICTSDNGIKFNFGDFFRILGFLEYLRYILDLADSIRFDLFKNSRGDKTLYH